MMRQTYVNSDALPAGSRLNDGSISALVLTRELRADHVAVLHGKPEPDKSERRRRDLPTPLVPDMIEIYAHRDVQRKALVVYCSRNQHWWFQTYCENTKEFEKSRHVCQSHGNNSKINSN